MDDDVAIRRLACGRGDLVRAARVRFEKNDSLAGERNLIRTRK